MSLETQIVQGLCGLLFAGITAGIGIIVPKIEKFIESHITAKNAVIVNDALDGLSKIVESVVADFNQRVVVNVKARNGWTPDLATQTKQDAIAAIKSQGAAFIQLIDKTSANSEAIISTLIEQAVAKAKK